MNELIKSIAVIRAYKTVYKNSFINAAPDFI